MLNQVQTNYFKMLEIMRFRSKEEAERYAKRLTLADGTNIPAKVRMLKDPNHEFANNRGNVPIIRTGRGMGGWEYLYTDGQMRTNGWDGQLNVY